MSKIPEGRYILQLVYTNPVNLTGLYATDLKGPGYPIFLKPGAEVDIDTQAWYISPAKLSPGKIESETVDLDIYKITKHGQSTATPGFAIGQWPQVDLDPVPQIWSFSPVEGPNVPPNVYVIRPAYHMHHPLPEPPTDGDEVLGPNATKDGVAIHVVFGKFPAWQLIEYSK